MSFLPFLLYVFYLHLFLPLYLYYIILPLRTRTSRTLYTLPFYLLLLPLPRLVSAPYDSIHSTTNWTIKQATLVLGAYISKRLNEVCMKAEEESIRRKGIGKWLISWWFVVNFKFVDVRQVKAVAPATEASVPITSVGTTSTTTATVSSTPIDPVFLNVRSRAFRSVVISFVTQNISLLLCYIGYHLFTYYPSIWLTLSSPTYSTFTSLFPLSNLFFLLTIYTGAAGVFNMIPSLVMLIYGDGIACELTYGDVMKSESLSQLWCRWNTPIHQWFVRCIYKPIIELATNGGLTSSSNSSSSKGTNKRRVSPSIKLFACLVVFFSSGLLHEYQLWVVNGYITGNMLIFFLLHGLVVCMEQIVSSLPQFQQWKLNRWVKRLMVYLFLVWSSHWFLFDFGLTCEEFMVMQLRNNGLVVEMPKLFAMSRLPGAVVENSTLMMGGNIDGGVKMEL